MTTGKSDDTSTCILTHGSSRKGEHTHIHVRVNTQSGRITGSYASKILGQSRNKQTHYLQASSPCDSSESFCYKGSSASLSNCTAAYCRYPVWAKTCRKEKKKKSFHCSPSDGRTRSACQTSWRWLLPSVMRTARRKMSEADLNWESQASCWVRQQFANLSAGSFILVLLLWLLPESPTALVPGVHHRSHGVGRMVCISSPPGKVMKTDFWGPTSVTFLLKGCEGCSSLFTLFFGQWQYTCKFSLPLSLLEATLCSEARESSGCGRMSHTQDLLGGTKVCIPFVTNSQEWFVFKLCEVSKSMNVITSVILCEVRLFSYTSKGAERSYFNPK